MTSIAIGTPGHSFTIAEDTTLATSRGKSTGAQLCEDWRSDSRPDWIGFVQQLTVERHTPEEKAVPWKDTTTERAANFIVWVRAEDISFVAQEVDDVDEL